jgi:cysteine desulfurase
MEGHSGYFDFNATTPLSVAAREAWLRAAERHWQNPSSLYKEAGLASQALELAREQLADLLGGEAERVVFTAGATEGNNAVFASVARRMKADERVAISAVEHPSVREAARHWVGAGRVDELAVSAEGVVAVETVERWLAGNVDKAALVSVMAANNESGALQPWREIAALCADAGVRFHTDAAQWVGKLGAEGVGVCDLVTGSAHKFGGPKGVGFVMLPEEVAVGRWRLLFGGPQEEGRRAGTENYSGIAAMVAALEACTGEGSAVGREAFEVRMRELFPEVRVIGQGAERLWNTSLLVMPRHSNLKWLTRLSQAGYSISTGSACSSGKEGSSVVVRALGASEEELRRVVRVSGGREHTVVDWLRLAEAFERVGADLDAGKSGVTVNVKGW